MRLGELLLQPAKLRQSFLGEGLIPVDGGALAVIAQSLLVNDIRNGFVGRMQFFEFLVG